MATTQQLVVGIFRDRAQAEQAINELLQSGFDNHQIRFAEQGTTTGGGGMLDKIKSVFTGQDMSTGGIYDDLVKMGAPPDDARYYQSEFEAGCSIVAVLGTAGMQQAGHVLAQHGGYGANQRFAQSADYNRNANAQQPATEDAAGYRRQQPPQQAASSGQEAQQTGTSNAYYDLVSCLYHALQAEQTSAAYAQDAQQSGNQDLVQFFSEVHQNASREAERAKQLLASVGAGRGPFRNNQPEREPSLAHAGSSYANQDYRSEQERRPQQDYRSEQERRAEQERRSQESPNPSS